MALYSSYQPLSETSNTGNVNLPGDNYVYDMQGTVGKINSDGSVSILPGWSSDGGDDLGNVNIFTNQKDASGNSVLLGTFGGNDIPPIKTDIPRANVIAQVWANQLEKNKTEDSVGFSDALKVIAPIALIAAAPLTGGASLFVGEMAMGASAAEAAATVAGVAAGTATATAGAATVGAALLGSATSATMAAISGGDVTKSAIAGAIGGGAAANAGDIANALTNNSVNAIAASTGLTAAQVSNTITNAVSAGVVTAAVTGGDVKTAVASSLAASGVSAEVQNTINNNLPDMSGTAKLVGNVAGVATKAAVSGTDVGTAIQNSIPNIIGGQLQDTTKTDTSKQVSQADTADTGTAVVVTSDPTNNTALVMSTDGNVSVVATTDNIPSGSTVKIDPTTNVATVANVATTGTTFAPTASAGTVVSDVTPSPDLVKPEGKVTISGDTFVYDPATDPRTEEQKLADYNAAIEAGNTPEDAAKMANYIPPTTSEITPTITTPEITPTVVPKDVTTTATQPTQTQQVVDLISGPSTGGTGTDKGVDTTITPDTKTTTTTPVQDVPIETPTVADKEPSKDIAKDITKQPASSPALTSILSPSIIPSKASAITGVGPSTAYLGQALGTVSPDSALSGGGTPVLSGEEGKKRNVWNIESLRNALGI